MICKQTFFRSISGLWVFILLLVVIGCAESEGLNIRSPESMDLEVAMRFDVQSNLKPSFHTNLNQLQVKVLLESDRYEYQRIHLLQIKVGFVDTFGQMLYENTKQQDQASWTIDLPEDDGSYLLSFEIVEDETFEKLLLGEPVKWEKKVAIDRNFSEPTVAYTYLYEAQTDTRAIAVELLDSNEAFFCRDTSLIAVETDQTLALADSKVASSLSSGANAVRLEKPLGTLLGPFEFYAVCEDGAGNQLAIGQALESEPVPAISLKVEQASKVRDEQFRYFIDLWSGVYAGENFDVEIQESFLERHAKNLFLYLSSEQTTDSPHWIESYSVGQVQLPHPASLDKDYFLHLVYDDGVETKILSTQTIVLE